MRSLLILPILALILASCASKQERIEQNNLKEEIAKTPPKTDAQRYEEEKEILQNTSSLSLDQKQKLYDLMIKSKKENQDVQKEISQTKLVLFKELLSDKENKTRINILENKLVKLNRKQTRNSLNAYKEAKAILGKNDESLERTLQIIDERSLRETTL